MQRQLFDITGNAIIDKQNIVTDLFQAYFNARKNKRNTINALAFEKHLESNLFALHEEIISYKYQPKKSICFIVNKPVKREIFAADFRDRIVHHFIYNYISPIFEKRFIHDSYSCRVGKGTHYGIQRVNHFIRSCSENYSKECYILKLDIKGYFMAMNKKIIYEKIASLLNKEKMKHSFDLALTLHLIEQTLFNNPTKDCITKSSMSDWEGLPPTKSLFHAKSGCGLPIGNLTSQLFGNIYLNEFDHFVKRDLKIRFYGRYVDDFVLIHPDKNYLASIIPVMKNFLSDNLQLELHPDKIYLQHYSKGVKYLGAVIKPHRIYMANRTKGNFYQSIETWNIIIRAEKKLTKEEQDGFLSSMNSYLGIMKHYKTYKLRKKMLKENLSAYFWNYFYIGKNYVKLVRKIKKVRGLNFFLCMACSCWTVGYLG